MALGAKKSESGSPTFLVADANSFFDLIEKDFAVSDFARRGGSEDAVDGLVDEVVGHDHLDFDLGEQINTVLLPAIVLRVSLLAAMAAYLGNSHALHAQIGECAADGFEPVRLNDRFH